MKKTFEVRNLMLAMAAAGIAENSKPSITARVLAELLNKSDAGVITHATAAGKQICETLDITQANYRFIMGKLTKMGLVAREQSTLYLYPTIRPPFSEILITQKQSVE